MNDIEFNGAQKRIDFYGRWGLAFFTVFIVLVSWLCNSIIAGKFGIMFQLGIGGVLVTATIWCGFFWAAHRRIKRLEEHKHV